MTDKQLPAKLHEYTPAALFAEGKAADVVTEIENHIGSIAPDLSTQKGRDRVASECYLVARSRVYIENARKDFNRPHTDAINAANAIGRGIKERLQTLEDNHRAPLVEWLAEDDRKSREQNDRLKAIESTEWPHDIDGINATLEHLASITPTEELFGKHLQRAEGSLRFTIEAGQRALEAAEDRAKQEREAEELREKLAELKQQADELEAANRELENEKRRLEEKEQAKKNKAEAAKRKRAEAKEQKEREARIAREAAEKATREAEERAEAARVAAEQERQRIEDERIAREAAEAEIERQRAEDEKHVARVDEVIVEAIEKAIDGLTGESPHANAIAILDALKFGLIPRVSIDY